MGTNNKDRVTEMIFKIRYPPCSARTSGFWVSHNLNSANPSFRNTWRREKRGWFLQATTASSLNSESKSKTKGNRSAAAMASIAATWADGLVEGDRERMYASVYPYEVSLKKTPSNAMLCNRVDDPQLT